MHVYDLINTQDTHLADANQTVLDVARAMVERNIGAVPVLRDGLLVQLPARAQAAERRLQLVAEGVEHRRTVYGRISFNRLEQPSCAGSARCSSFRRVEKDQAEAARRARGRRGYPGCAVRHAARAGEDPGTPGGRR